MCCLYYVGRRRRRGEWSTDCSWVATGYRRDGLIVINCCSLHALTTFQLSHHAICRYLSPLHASWEAPFPSHSPGRRQLNYRDTLASRVSSASALHAGSRLRHTQMQRLLSHRPFPSPFCSDPVHREDW